MEFDILYRIQDMHCAWLDRFFLILTGAAGSYGQIWLILAAVLLLFRKTRRCGFTILLSYALVFVIGQYGLKDLAARPRPCHIDGTVALLIERPSSFSFPSTHSAWAFGAAGSVFCRSRKAGLLCGIPALLIAFSRLYLFVHFPTDVLAGILLGILSAVLSFRIVEAVGKKTGKKESA